MNDRSDFRTKYNVIYLILVAVAGKSKGERLGELSLVINKSTDSSLEPTLDRNSENLTFEGLKRFQL